MWLQLRAVCKVEQPVLLPNPKHIDVTLKTNQNQQHAQPRFHMQSMGKCWHVFVKSLVPHGMRSKVRLFIYRLYSRSSVMIFSLDTVNLTNRQESYWQFCTESDYQCTVIRQLTLPNFTYISATKYDYY